MRPRTPSQTAAATQAAAYLETVERLLRQAGEPAAAMSAAALASKVRLTINQPRTP